MSCFYYPTMYLAFLPLILRMNTTSSHDTPNATTAAAGICKGTGFWQKALNGFNLMAEVCPGHAEDLHTATYTVNVGGTYSIWKDHINLIAELNDGKFFSGGIFFKLHLK